MNKLISLTKLQVKDFISKYKDGLNVKNPWIGTIVLILAGVSLLFPGIIIARSLYTPLALMGYPQLIITFMYIAAVTMMLFTSIPFIMSIFFYSKDISFLSSLPIKENVIVFSKLCTIYMYLLVVNAFIFGPALAIYILNSVQGVLLVIPGLLGFLLSPILPLALATIIIFPLMRIIGQNKRRNLFAIIGNILLLFVIIGMQLMMTRVETDPELVQQLLMESDGILELISSYFPPSMWITNLVRGTGIDALLFIGLTMVLIFVLQLLSKFIYRKSILAFNQQGSVSIKPGKMYYKKRNVGLQLIKRHILIITSNPTFFLNVFISMFVPVLMFGIMSFTGELSLEMLNSPLIAPFRLYIFIGIISAPAIIASTSATAITREGQSFWETKVLPISPKSNIQYRILTSIILCFLSSILLGILSLYFIKLSWIEILIGSLGCISVTLFLSTIDMIINIYRPLLNWTNPTAAVKNNLNVTIALGLRVIIGGLVYLIYNLAKDFAPDTIVLICTILFFLLYIITRQILYKVFIKKFNNISV